VKKLPTTKNETKLMREIYKKDTLKNDVKSYQKSQKGYRKL
jgi:hypothetical protein